MAITLSFTTIFQPNLHPFSAKNHHSFHRPKPTKLSFSTTLQNPLQNGRFLTNQELEKLDHLSNYTYNQQLKTGFLTVRLMRDEEMDMTVGLLSESFAESMMIASATGGGYAKLLRFLVKNYLIERREKSPHNATLIGVYKENGEEDDEFAGTVEVTFDQMGANVSPPTPFSPKNSPYLCNMAVSKELRRRGIGWHLLKAGEELITHMSSVREVYLHCRVIDEGPLSMYTKAGYRVVQTDNILTLLKFQRRKYLMRKDLSKFETPSAMDIPNEELS